VLFILFLVIHQAGFAGFNFYKVLTLEKLISFLFTFAYDKTKAKEK